LMHYANAIGYPKHVTREILQNHRKWLAHVTTTFVRNGSLGPAQLGRLDAVQRLYATYRIDPFVWGRIVPMLLLPASAVRLLTTIARLTKRRASACSSDTGRRRS
jgi:hypothetical protein